MTVCSYHVTYAFQSESTLCSCLNVKELLARSRREIWSLSDCNWTRTQNYLVCKRTLNHLAKLSLAKWLSRRLRTKWFWVQVQLQSLKRQICACFEQGVPWHSSNYVVWIHSETHSWHDKNIQSNALYR